MIPSNLRARRPSLLPRLVIRTECSVWLELETRGTIPKYAASLPSSAKSLTSPITLSRMLPLSGPIPLMLVRFLCPSSLLPSSAIVFFQLGDALVQATDLFHDDLQFDPNHRVEL